MISQSMSETQANSTATEKILSQPNGPVAPIESKNRSNILERTEIEEPKRTKVKDKKSKKFLHNTRIKHDPKWTTLYSYSGTAEESEQIMKNF